MAHWQETLTALGDRADRRIDRLMAKIKSRLAWNRPYQIVPYRGYGNAQTLFLRGRVLQGKPQPIVADKDTVWDNLHNMFQRFASAEVAGAVVEAVAQGQSYQAVCDEEGYFFFELSLQDPLPPNVWWHAVPLTLQSPTSQSPTSQSPASQSPASQSPASQSPASQSPPLPISASGQVFVPPAESKIGIISDIDDTVIQTGATNLLKMARVIFLNNARTRLPFEGVAGFYQALHRGATGTQHNPIFYVSSSPWNLYDLLVDFLQVQGIPLGPVFLQDYGIDRHKFIHTNHAIHKLAAIEEIMAFYPHLSFVLIGDSGQEDPEIYLQVLNAFPKRVRSIYIRDVSRGRRDQAVQALISKAAEQQVDMLLVPDTLTAAHHAHANGFISTDSLPLIEKEKTKDANAPSDIEILLDKHG